jgi:hypothetical protein
MRVSNSLAGRLANVDADVVAVRYGARFNVTPNRWKKDPNGGLFFTCSREEIAFMSPGNN